MYAFPIIKDLLVKEKFYVLFSKKKEKKNSISTTNPKWQVVTSCY